jgi:tRNA (Thr-GGU) A37 N-methylase
VVLIPARSRRSRRARAHPRNDPSQPLLGVFAARSPDRPNPLGLHQPRSALSTARACGSGLEAIDARPRREDRLARRLKYAGRP